MVYPDLNRLNTEAIRLYSVWAVLGILGNLISYFLAILCSHIGAFERIYDLKIEFANYLATRKPWNCMTIRYKKQTIHYISLMTSSEQPI